MDDIQENVYLSSAIRPQHQKAFIEHVLGPSDFIRNILLGVQLFINFFLGEQQRINSSILSVQQQSLVLNLSACYGSMGDQLQLCKQPNCLLLINLRLNFPQLFLS